MGPWRAGWRRLRRDRWAFAALVVVCLLLVLALAGGKIVTEAVGHSGETQFPYAANDSQRPVGPLTRIPALTVAPISEYGALLPAPKGSKTTVLLLGADGPLGRDELIRLLDGLRTSLEIGLLATLVALVIGLPVGTIAGYFGGIVDTVVSQFTETIMAFPLLLFLVFVSANLSHQIREVAWGSILPAGAFGEAVLIGAFTAFYPTRLVRAQLLSLRHADFVEAAHMVGASNARILRRHLLPHLAPTLLVWAAIATGTNILAEVGLSFIGVGVQPSTPTLGSLLSTVWGTIYQPHTYDTRSYTPWQTIFPMATIVLTVVCLNRLAEGARRALEPRSGR